MLSNTKKKQLAEELYVTGRMNAREIAIHLGVSEQTLTKWKKGNKAEKSWDDRKKELSLTPVRLKEKLLEEAENIANGKPSLINADSLSKVMSAIDKLDKKISLRVIIDVVKEIDNYVSKHDPKLAVIFTEWHKKFIIYRSLTE
ncbi:MAG: hypothetical protein NTZ33_13915 [Bacteroidetes bacterium]|nr:hypothetical protein [Bacteroidota bacterium]